MGAKIFNIILTWYWQFSCDKLTNVTCLALLALCLQHFSPACWGAPPPNPQLNPTNLLSHTTHTGTFGPCVCVCVHVIITMSLFTFQHPYIHYTTLIHYLHCMCLCHHHKFIIYILTSLYTLYYIKSLSTFYTLINQYFIIYNVFHACMLGQITLMLCTDRTHDTAT